MPDELPQPGKNRHNMCLSGLAVQQPECETLLEYTSVGCPVKTVRNWNKEEIHVAVMRVPHESTLAEKVIAYFSAKAKRKV